MPTNRIPFEVIELGDMVALPDGHLHMARSKVMLPTPAGSMGGFILCGEFEVLLATPGEPGGPVGLYVPVPKLPSQSLTTHAEGAANYWAPHLPSIQGAMAEVLWRVAMAPATPDPVTIMWRGAEPVIFAKAADYDQGDLGMLWAKRSDENQFGVTRETGMVQSPTALPEAAPVVQPAPVRQREHVVVR